jgi:glutamate decarboxylase
MLGSSHRHRGRQLENISVNPLFAQGSVLAPIPARMLPAGEMSSAAAYQIIHDELMLDGNARQNLATFVTTWMEPEVGLLMAECLPKNMINKDEYPQTAEMEHRCVAMLADLWHAPDPTKAPGCSTVGSSEACMLGGLAMKRRWQLKRKAAGKPADKPNIVMGINVQVCWDKFANYFEVEPRLVPMDGERFHLSAEEAIKLVDENTIGVVAVMGSTFDGSYEDVAEISKALDRLHQESDLDVPIHVDGASGGMIAPFLDPELPWDFRIPRVASINTSGHKYGLVFPGVGWVVWRDQEALPEELIYHVNYLGGDMPTFALNFSRPGAQIVAQYYMFLRLGREGYRVVHGVCREVAGAIAERLAEMGPFELITDGSQLPVVAFRVKARIKNFNVFDVSRRLRERGWQVPAYTFPANRQDLAVLRIVVRNGFSHDLAGLFLADLERLLPELEHQTEPMEAELAVSFRH